MHDEERKAKTRERVARWRARHPERARAQTKEALKRFYENKDIELASLRAEVKRLKAVIAHFNRRKKNAV